MNLLLLVDTFGSSQTVTNLLKLPSWYFAYGFTIYGLVLFFQGKRPKFFLIKINNSLFFSLFLTLAVVLGLVEFLTPDNYVYSLTRIHPEGLAIVAHLSMMVWWLGLKEKTSIKKWALWLLPIWIFLVSFWVSLLPFDAFVAFTLEDGPIENLQFGVVLLTSLVAFWRGLSLGKSAK